MVEWPIVLGYLAFQVGDSQQPPTVEFALLLGSGAGLGGFLGRVGPKSCRPQVTDTVSPKSDTERQLLGLPARSESPLKGSRSWLPAAEWGLHGGLKAVITSPYYQTPPSP